MSRAERLFMENAESQSYEVLGTDNPTHDPTDPRHHANVKFLITYSQGQSCLNTEYTTEDDSYINDETTDISLLEKFTSTKEDEDEEEEKWRRPTGEITLKKRAKYITFIATEVVSHPDIKKGKKVNIADDISPPFRLLFNPQKRPYDSPTESEEISD
ncbi:hypothetical protein EVAR_67100_1 [Eumeta japonica]|uniref:Uncharacterized protein n=1 Tax=Eumeta variegata TaxID=151549 RepID=A0A4C1ZRX2_EUMVA|nr:hypothetical protein EVAR_67100_1 [Eumeta japonica]